MLLKGYLILLYFSVLQVENLLIPLDDVVVFYKGVTLVANSLLSWVVEAQLLPAFRAVLADRTSAKLAVAHCIVCANQLLPGELGFAQKALRSFGLPALLDFVQI